VRQPPGGQPETKRPAFEPLSPEALRGVLAQVAVREKKARDGTEAHAIVPDDLAGLRHPGLPPARTVVEAPSSPLAVAS
jgi:hypothetical protein